jgi:type IV pilus assembly protein PilN
MQITLNLATRPYTDIRPALKRVRIALGVLGVLALGLGLGLHAVHQKAEEARATEQSVQNQINAITAERQGYQSRMNEPDNVELLAHIGELNKLIDEKSFSWTLAMEDLEMVLPVGVQVTNLEPVRDQKTSQITLKLRVVGPRDRAVDLVRNLERSKHFLLPRIVGESAESTGGPNAKLEPISASNRVNFDLLAEYNAAAPVELDLRAEREQLGEKPLAAGEPLGRKAQPNPQPSAKPHSKPNPGSKSGGAR